MRSDLFKAVLATFIAITTLSFQVEARERVDRRQTRQNIRVQEGIRSGDITDREATRLRHSKRVVRRAEHRAGQDGVITGEEKIALEKLQDARSQQIHRVKSNDKKKEQQ